MFPGGNGQTGNSCISKFQLCLFDLRLVLQESLPFRLDQKAPTQPQHRKTKDQTNRLCDYGRTPLVTPQRQLQTCYTPTKDHACPILFNSVGVRCLRNDMGIQAPVMFATHRLPPCPSLPSAAPPPPRSHTWRMTTRQPAAAGGSAPPRSRPVHACRAPCTSGEAWMKVGEESCQGSG